MYEAEWLTRKRRIDTKLRSVKPPWKIVRYQEGMDCSILDACAVEEYPTSFGCADYALFVKGKLLGIVEAKKVTVNPQNVLEQAKRYSRDVPQGVGNWNGYRIPFLYASNGEIIWFADARNRKLASRPISTFHTPIALADLLEANTDASSRWLKNNAPNDIPRLRYYQKEAITNIEEALIDGQRRMLLALATGTGKTFLTVAQIYRLLESRFARRILFLVDRKALAAQAVRECASFNTPHGRKFDQEYEVYSQKFRREDFGDDDPFNPKLLPSEYLLNPSTAHTFVYICTIQRMALTLFDREKMPPQLAGDADYEDDAETMDIPIHAFDILIADECHRGYNVHETNVWRDTIDHFDAVKIGLTATPAAHTVALFADPVYRYSVERGISDGYLVDYEPVIINSNVRMNGVFLQEGETVGRIDTTTGEEVFDELEDERQFDSSAVEHDITSPNSNRQIIQEIAKYAYEHEKETGNFPKILIFAVNDLPHTSHADSLVRICREVFNQGDQFVQKITGNPNVDRPLQKIREFRNRTNPKIVVTVDMLSTGVDIPSLEFLVFLRPVKSRILWEQMLGRGTRLCPEINKTHFTIFDCFGGTLIEYFRHLSNFQIEAPTKEPTSLAQVIENIYQNVDRPYYVRVLVKRLRRVEKDLSGNARDEFAKYIPDGDVGTFAGRVPQLIKNDFTRTLGLLRDKEFQNLLLTYERKRRVFLVGYETEDIVTSEKRARFGKFETPQDYLTAFSTFIKENSDKITALQILLQRPKQWRTQALEDLRQKLRVNDFNERQLQEAHRLVYHKALVDIVSMVKHAAREEEPILTAEERVGRAMASIATGQTFTDEQQKWLDLIRQHLIENLTIDEDDFDNMPIFDMHGGKIKARRLFHEQLPQLLDQLNLAIAA